MPEMADLAGALLEAATWAAGPAPDVQKGDLLQVCTSGTTGPPKGAMHTAAGLQANTVAAIAAQALGKVQRAALAALLPDGRRPVAGRATAACRVCRVCLRPLNA
jgi:acyl-CoA synthetase (AMP-forming)/AMP-acid ligase II